MLSVLSACASHDPLPKCKGATFALNAGHWHPTEADLKRPQERGYK
ncbi:type IV secretion system lipoprotein VirB7 (plasmid) [Komagataeibacter nataicola]|uniref:Type IV secretion system protein VirB7 n=2 Tax=Acetobacterales TaxID=3120395 RepID=A0ABR9YQ31_9PROT|nr:type IV secretion system lipoprotein VirB7 [Komagataeibacter nataicola]MBF0865875.1 type IV secretion system protein VirB7 [Gluconobacter sp. R71656]MBF0868665.1 type IV secretion system protein VirB7 [Gluconobacter sp. R75628]MBF0874647.1 type IV secretion system protein VirB7 [Gluconobacter sp. R75629]MBF0883905.1 type IV secretion system protein VirB7 [Gluconobacter potus]WEQ54370.1 type IV secretion system lipoprotein VirB7 [Komagataeibacter nataicola]